MALVLGLTVRSRTEDIQAFSSVDLGIAIAISVTVVSRHVLLSDRNGIYLCSLIVIVGDLFD